MVTLIDSVWEAGNELKWFPLTDDGRFARVVNGRSTAVAQELLIAASRADTRATIVVEPKKLRERIAQIGDEAADLIKWLKQYDGGHLGQLPERTPGEILDELPLLLAEVATETRDLLNNQRSDMEQRVRARLGR